MAPKSSVTGSCGRTLSPPPHLPVAATVLTDRRSLLTTAYRCGVLGVPVSPTKGMNDGLRGPCSARVCVHDCASADGCKARNLPPPAKCSVSSLPSCRPALGSGTGGRLNSPRGRAPNAGMWNQPRTLPAGQFREFVAFVFGYILLICCLGSPPFS